MSIFFNKGVAILVTLCAVFLLALIAIGILRRAFERYQERYISESSTKLYEMFLFVDSNQLLILSVCCTGLMALIGLLASGVFVAILLAVVGFWLPPRVIAWLRNRRVRKFNTQLVDSLNAMANAFKAGMSFPQAIEQVSQEASPPLSQEFGMFVREIKLGVPLDDALLNMAGRVGSEDLDLVATATIISRQLGGNMAEMFDTIAATIRERFRLEGKIRALTAQGKMQGWIVAALPLILGLVINWMRPDLMQPMFDSWYGYALVLVIVVMEAAGIWMIRRIVAIDV